MQAERKIIQTNGNVIEVNPKVWARGSNYREHLVTQRVLEDLTQAIDSGDKEWIKAAQYIAKLHLSEFNKIV